MQLSLLIRDPLHGFKTSSDIHSEECMCDFAGCDSGKDDELLNGYYWYHVSAEKMSYNNAKLYCQSFNGNLAHEENIRSMESRR